jgi:hypothetical protein
MGGGKSQSSTTPVVTQEQKDYLRAQTGFLTDTALPAYKQTIGKAGEVYAGVEPKVSSAAETASNVAGRTGAANEIAGTAGLMTGMSGLASLFDPKYEEGQVNAALQSGRESGRELVNQQNAGYGASGGLGSARSALANANLASLQEQRQATAAANARAGVQANKAAAANQLATIGSGALNAANTAAASRIGYAGAPQDAYAKYASVIFGTPQQSTTANFAGTQGSNTSGKGMGFKLS